MATFRQRLAAQKIVDNRGIISKTMREVGYASATAKNPKNLTRSKGWHELMEQYFPDDILARGVKTLIDHKDWRARDAGLDKAFKLKGRYAAEKVKFEDPFRDMTAAELVERRKLIEAKLKETREDESNESTE